LKGYGFYWDQRFKKQKDLGVIHKNAELSLPDYKSWRKVENKQEEDLNLAVILPR